MRIKIFLFLLAVTLAGTLHAKNDFETVIKRVVAEILKSPVDDDRVSEFINTLSEDGSWPYINYEDVSATGFENSRHLSNLVEMSLAYNTKSSRYYRNKKLKQDVNRSLAHWVEHDYICDNWWFNQIFTPRSLVTILLVMDKHVEPGLAEQAVPIIGRAHLDASGARESGDRIKIAGILAKKLLVVDDEPGFEEVMKVSMTYGEYDALVQVNTENLDQLNEFLTDKLRVLPDIFQTATLIVAKTHLASK